MLLSIKTKLKLSQAQEITMCKHAGIARFTYNWGLAAGNNLYKDGLKPNKYILKKFFNNHVKPEFTWIKETGICQKITQYAFDNLGDAFSRFLSKKGGYPNFKKKGHHDSFTIDAGGTPIPVGGKSVKLPRIGWVKTYEGLPHTTCKSITISRTADSWFIALADEQEHEPTVKQHDVVGVDVGVKELATLSTGVVFPNPKHYKTHLEKLRRLSRRFAKKIKGSNNRYKAKIQLALHLARVANLRKDTLHPASCPQHSCLFCKTCSNCGHIQDMPLKERTYNCGSCGHSIDRDLQRFSGK